MSSKLLIFVCWTDFAVVKTHFLDEAATSSSATPNTMGARLLFLIKYNSYYISENKELAARIHM